jgi:hypothetical protein
MRQPITLVPDLDMAGARGWAIAALVLLHDPAGGRFIAGLTDAASTRFSDA